MRKGLLERREFAGILLGAGLSLVLPRQAIADKAGALVQGPKSARKGEEITLRLTFTHNSNTPSHFIEWARVLVNEKEVARWDFSPSRLPEGATLVRELRIPVQGALRVRAQASCNKHGSKGAASLDVQVD